MSVIVGKEEINLLILVNTIDRLIVVEDILFKFEMINDVFWVELRF